MGVFRCLRTAIAEFEQLCSKMHRTPRSYNLGERVPWYLSIERMRNIIKHMMVSQRSLYLIYFCAAEPIS